jgi:hypothetical protein
VQDFDAVLNKFAEKVCVCGGGGGGQCRTRSNACQARVALLTHLAQPHVCKQFEKSENKPVVIGYVAAAAAAILIAEWFIHLPVLNAVRAVGPHIPLSKLLPVLGLSTR